MPSWLRCAPCQDCFDTIDACRLEPELAYSRQIGEERMSRDADRHGSWRTGRTLAQVVAVVLVGGAAGGLRQWLFQSAAERVMFRLRCGLFEQLLRQEVGFYDRVRVGTQPCPTLPCLALPYLPTRCATRAGQGPQMPPSNALRLSTSGPVLWHVEHCCCTCHTQHMPPPPAPTRPPCPPPLPPQAS
jgi:hypothetical protein